MDWIMRDGLFSVYNIKFLFMYLLIPLSGLVLAYFYGDQVFFLIMLLLIFSEDYVMGKLIWLNKWPLKKSFVVHEGGWL